MKTLDTEIAFNSQDAVYTEIFDYAQGQRLRLTIRSDVYPFQCFAKIERWDGAKWQMVAHIEPGAMTTPSGIIHHPLKVREALFIERLAEDRAVLLKRASLVL